MDEKPPTYYASAVNVVSTPWDLTLQFSQRHGPTAKDVEPVANVILSPQHAYVLARLLGRIVDDYERNIGKINLPPRLLNDLGIEE